MVNKLKKATVPLLASLVMVMAVGGYFTFASTITVEPNTDNTQEEAEHEETQTPSNPDNAIINGKEVPYDENGCASNGNLTLCKGNDNPTPTPSSSQEQTNDPQPTNICKQVCVSYQTVCE